MEKITCKEILSKHYGTILAILLISFFVGRKIFIQYGFILFDIEFPSSIPISLGIELLFVPLSVYLIYQIEGKENETSKKATYITLIKVAISRRIIVILLSFEGTYGYFGGGELLIKILLSLLFIIIDLFLSYSSYFIISGNEGIIQSIKSSISLTRKIFRKTLLRFVSLLTSSMLLGIATNILLYGENHLDGYGGAIFIAVYSTSTMIIWYVLYQNNKNKTMGKQDI